VTLRILDEPFYTGTQVLATVPEPYDIGIAGRGYVIEPTKCTRRFLEQLREVGPQVDEVGEALVNPANLWRRGQSDWSHGAGQVWFDSSAGADRSRFRQSKGVDCWTPFQLSMLPDANTRKKAATGTNLRLLSDPANTDLWLIDGGAVYVTGNPSATSPTWSTASGLPGTTITGATITGAHVYVCANGVVYRAAVGTTVFSSWFSAGNVTGVQYANGRLFGWNNAIGQVFELKADATRVDLFTHPQGAAFDWDSIVGAPNAAYMAGHVGYSAEIYRTDVRDATGTLTAPVLAGSIVNERVTAMLTEAGYVILATQFSDGVGRLRLCQIVNPLYVTGGALQIGPNIFSQLGQQPTSAINALATVGRFVYFSWANLDSTCTGVGRFDLSTFTQPNIPAYATDQMAGTSSGVVQGPVLGIVPDAASNQLWFAVSGAGVYGTTGPTSFMRENYLDTGRIRYGLVDPKVLAKLDFHCNPIPGTTITALPTHDDGTTGTLRSYTAGGTGPTVPYGMDHKTVEWADLRFTFTDDSAGHPPVLTWWKLQVIPAPGAVEQIVVTIIMRDRVRAGPEESAPLQDFDVEYEIAFLRALAASRQIVTYQTGSTAEDVYVDNIEQQPDRLSYGNRHMEGHLAVEMRTLS
jgi:hypothetical protein